MIPAAEDFGEIKRRMRELREEQGMLDDDPLTAASEELDYIGTIYGLTREASETDENFRVRLLVKITARQSRQ